MPALEVDGYRRRSVMSKLKEGIEESSQMPALSIFDVEVGKGCRKDGGLEAKVEWSPTFIEKAWHQCGVGKRRHTILQIHSCISSRIYSSQSEMSLRILEIL